MSIKSDEDYHNAIKELIAYLQSRLDSPELMPISPTEQANFIHAILYQTANIRRSEPHLRGAVVESLNKMKAFDVERIKRERDRYRQLAQELYQVLEAVPAVRLGPKDRLNRKAVLEAANEII